MLQVNQVPPGPALSLLDQRNPSDEIDFGWLICAVRRRLWGIILLSVLGATLAAGYVTIRTSNYTAFTQLQLTNLKLTFSRDDAFYAESQSDPTFLETQIQIMRSAKIALATVDNLQLATSQSSGDPDKKDGSGLGGLIAADGPLGEGGPFGWLRSTFELLASSNQNAASSPVSATDPLGEARRAALKKFQRSYSVERVGLSNIVEIRYTAPDREQAARGANELAQVYIADQQAARIEAAQSASIWLRERLRDVGPRARIVAAAVPPMDKSDPRGVLIVAIGLIAGGVIGVAFALFRHFLDNTVRTPEQAEAATGVECLGIVPKLKGRSRRGRLKPASGEKGIEAGAPLMDEALRNPFGRLARTLHNTRIAIDDTLGGKGARCIGVTSTYPGEGVSTIAVNLARSLAASGERVLLVDCNATRPTLSSALAPKERRGLIDFVQSNEESIEEFIHSDPDGTLRFMPMGGEGVTPVRDLLWTDARPKFLAAANRDFDYLVCDLPPLASIGDVRGATAHLDSFVFVLGWGKVDVDHLRVGIRSAGAFRGKLAGLVMNRASPVGLRQTASPGAAFFSRKLSLPRSKT